MYESDSPAGPLVEVETAFSPWLQRAAGGFRMDTPSGGFVLLNSDVPPEVQWVGGDYPSPPVPGVAVATESVATFDLGPVEIVPGSLYRWWSASFGRGQAPGGPTRAEVDIIDPSHVFVMRARYPYVPPTGYKSSRGTVWYPQFFTPHERGLVKKKGTVALPDYPQDGVATEFTWWPLPPWP